MISLCYPVLNGAASHIYSVQDGIGFMADAYYQNRHMVHSGSDWNATTGGNSDYGDPVYAIADGIVRDSGTYRGWGNDVLIRHKGLEQPDTYLESMYAHMSRVLVKTGQAVRFGQIIGYIGQGWHNEFLAHLHFEIRIKQISPPDWPSSLYPVRARAEQYCLQTRVDPEIYLAKHGAVKSLAEVNKIRTSLKLPVVGGFKG